MELLRFLTISWLVICSQIYCDFEEFPVSGQVVEARLNLAHLQPSLSLDMISTPAGTFTNAIFIFYIVEVLISFCCTPW